VTKVQGGGPGPSLWRRARRRTAEKAAVLARIEHERRREPNSAAELEAAQAFQSIDNAEIIETVHACRQPMIPVSTSLPR